MNIYDKYAKAKAKIKLLQLEIKELEPKILEEIESLTEPMKTDYGLFTKVKREYWQYSKEFYQFEKVKKEEIKGKQQEDIESGKAKKEEKTGLRFVEKKVKK